MAELGAGGGLPAPGNGNRPPARSVTFGDRIAAAVAARESQIVLGIDPDPLNLWRDVLAASGELRADLALQLADAEQTARLGPAAGATAVRPGSPAAGALAGSPRSAARVEAAAAVLAHCAALIDAAGPACVAVKPQLACFERLGFAGWLVLEAVCAHAHGAGLLVLADGKRGDVPVTAAAYAQALVGETPSPFGFAAGLGADAFTTSPLLGEDALEPFVKGAREARAGAFVLVRTSNPGAADVFDAVLADGRPLWERLAEMVARLGAPGRGASGLTDVGAVTGATHPEHLGRMRELMPDAVFLLPGVGAQGGDVASLAPAFASHRAGGLVTASRSIAGAHEATGGDPAASARAEAERLRGQAWGLG